MDPVSACGLAQELAGILVTVVKKIKEVIETMKGAKKALLDLLQRSERMRLLLELFRSLVKKLRDPTERNITLAFNDSACRRTVRDLEELVRKVSGAAKHSELWMRFNWVLYKNDATTIIAQLQGHEQDISSVLIFIAAAVTEGQLLDLKEEVVGHSRVSDAFEKFRSGGPPANKIATPAKETGAPANKTDTPASKTDAPANVQDTPAKETYTPANKTDAPASQKNTPGKEIDTPADETNAPTKTASTPGLHPLQKATVNSRQDEQQVPSWEALVDHANHRSIADKAWTYDQTVYRNLSSMADHLKQCSQWLGSVTKLIKTSGGVHRTRESKGYYGARDRLSDAAYWGDWDSLFEWLYRGREAFEEDWTNAVRLKPVEEANRMSFWTPLHQAAYNCAPVEIVQRLVDMGASRTLQTRYTGGEFQHSDVTALEIAHELGYAHLYGVLAPILRHYIPANVLMNLQRQFHDLLRSDLGDSVQVQHLWLPELVVLTELERPEMWFPLDRQTQSARRYLFRLDGRELLVLSLGKTEAGSSQLFRVSSTGWTQIEDAVVFGP